MGIQRILFKVVIVLLTLAGPAFLNGQTESASVNDSTDAKIVVALNALNENKPSNPNIIELLSRAETQREQVIKQLLKLLNAPNSSNNVKRYAAYYLGQLRAVEAIDCLAAQITLKPNFPVGGSLYVVESPWNGEPAVGALITIGTPSIPAAIRNLAESDNAKVRKLSLQVLVRIDGDRDISQLRVQKALKAEKDSQKQARLQTALKSLSEIK